jgi:hypothetical protein
LGQGWQSSLTEMVIGQFVAALAPATIDDERSGEAQVASPNCCK